MKPYQGKKKINKKCWTLNILISAITLGELFNWHSRPPHSLHIWNQVSITVLCCTFKRQKSYWNDSVLLFISYPTSLSKQSLNWRLPPDHLIQFVQLGALKLIPGHFYLSAVCACVNFCGKFIANSFQNMACCI